MLTQRWNKRRASYRPAGEVINTRAYEVAPLDETSAKTFVLTNHYSGTYPAARFRYGLYRGGTLCGTAVFSHPCNDWRPQDKWRRCRDRKAAPACRPHRAG